LPARASPNLSRLMPSSFADRSVPGAAWQHLNIKAVVRTLLPDARCPTLFAI